MILRLIGANEVVIQNIKPYLVEVAAGGEKL
jgi:hypothetical protein